MTLQEAKEVIAHQEGYNSWTDMYAVLRTSSDGMQIIYIRLKEVAELYAQSAREQAIDEVHELYLSTNHRSMYQQRAFREKLLALKENK